jgi:hypothetical protein
MIDFGTARRKLRAVKIYATRFLPLSHITKSTGTIAYTFRYQRTLVICLEGQEIKR